MDEAFAMVTRYKWAQSQQPPPAPPRPLPVQQSPVQPQPQLAPVHPWSVPPQPSPSYRHQLNQPWQPGPGTSTEFQPPGWPAFASNLSALNISGLSSYLDPTHTVPAHSTSTLSTMDGQRPSRQASSIGDGHRPTTSEVVRAAQHILGDDDDEPSK